MSHNDYKIRRSVKTQEAAREILMGLQALDAKDVRVTAHNVTWEDGTSDATSCEVVELKTGPRCVVIADGQREVVTPESYTISGRVKP